MITLILLVLLQLAPPELHVSVDHNRVTVGDELVYTARAVSQSSEPMKVVWPGPKPTRLAKSPAG